MDNDNLENNGQTGSARSKQTETDYKKIVSRLMRKFISMTGSGQTNEPSGYREFIQWFIDILPEYSASTKRLYRSAIRSMMQNLINETDDEILIKDYELILDNLESTTGVAGLSKIKDINNLQTSQKKSKGLPPDKLYKLYTYLEYRNGIYDRDIYLYLKATSLTGLRPKEWLDVQYIEEIEHPDDKMHCPALLVKNAKYSEHYKRAPSPYRTIYLNLSQQELAIIQAQIKSIQNHKQDYRKYYKYIYNTLSNTNKTLFRNTKHKNSNTNNITFYSARHQFIADCKASGMSKVLIASLVGHASDETAGEHYARKGKGKSGRFVNSEALDKNGEPIDGINPYLIRTDNDQIEAILHVSEFKSLKFKDYLKQKKGNSFFEI